MGTIWIRSDWYKLLLITPSQSLHSLSSYSSDPSPSLAAAVPIRTMVNARAAPTPHTNRSIMPPQYEGPVPFSGPGLHDQNPIRIPMAFTARSQRVRCGRVPIASSEVAPFYCTRENALLGIALVVTSVQCRMLC
jgi:hypothetical protein